MPVRLVAQRQLARELDLSVTQVGRLVKDGLPRVADGRGGYRYPLEKCRQWHQKRRAAARARVQGSQRVRSALDRARLLKAAATCQRAEQRLRLMQHDLVDPHMEPQVLELCAATTRDALATLPQEWGVRCDGLASRAQAFDVLLEISNAVLVTLREALASACRTVGEGPADDEFKPGNPPATLPEARARRWEADARVIELEVARADGALIPAAEAREQFSNIVAQVRARITGICGRDLLHFVGRSQEDAERALAAFADEVAGIWTTKLKH